MQKCGLGFQNQNKNTLDDLQHEQEFNLEQIINAVVYPYLRGDHRGVYVAIHNQTLQNEHHKPL